MFAPLPEEQAQTECRKLMDDMDLHRELVIAKGAMYGILICRDRSGAAVVLKAFSGQASAPPAVAEWVPPLFDPVAAESALAKNDNAIHELTHKIALSDAAVAGTNLRMQRKLLTEESLRAFYDLYRFPCIDGSVKIFSDLFPLYRKGGWLPPSGTGDCCAPKLLGYAFSHGLFPVSMAEFYYSLSSRTGQRVHKGFYPPCNERCGLVLPAMLGIDVLYRDDAIVVVNKPAGLLSVPGRGEDNQDCVVNRLKRLFSFCIEQPSVHRLDQDTSGILVLALTAAAQRHLSIQFQEGKVRKEYTGVLRGKLEESCAIVKGQKEGCIELPFRLDPENRPYQVYDEQQGKIGITLWKKIRERRIPHPVTVKVPEECETVMVFTPLTGRTHQIRLACADPHGLGLPLVGDRLYGIRKENERLLLHASHIEFEHPVTGETVAVNCPAPF
jgi:tRNA pseudouridine32 synthase / 23S rRNA pseudouridine746 synthase